MGLLDSLLSGGANKALRKPKKIQHRGKPLAEILKAHELHFGGKPGGVRADLRNTDMTEAMLPGADLSEAQASGVEFFRCDLSNANFSRANLRNANFRNANIKGAQFAGADMGVAILRETSLDGVDLSGVDLTTTLMPRGYQPIAGGAAQGQKH